jgi:hypothetical protein
MVMVDDENSDVVANAAEQKVIRGHRRICSKTYFKRHRGTQSADFAGPNPLFERFGRPDVVAIEADELPADRSDVAEEFVVQCFALGAKLCRAVSIGMVPRSRSVTCSRGMPPTKAARQTGLRTLDAHRDIQARDHARVLRVRFRTDSVMTPM